MFRWVLGFVGAIAAAIVLVCVGAGVAHATGPNISVTSSTIGRDASTGAFTYSITASADTYWGDVCTSDFCHLEIDVKFVNGSTYRIDTKPANTGTGASSTRSYSGSTLIGEVTDIRAHLVGSGGQFDGAWQAITDPYPDTEIDLTVNSLERVTTSGYLSWDVDVSASYWNLADGPCPSGTCYLYLKAKFADNSVATLDQTTMAAYTTFPRTFHFEASSLVLEAVQLQAVISNGTRTASSGWENVSDPYPTASVEMQIDRLHVNSAGKLVYDITGTGNNYWLEDGVCRTYTYCYMEVMHRVSSGAEGLLEVDAQQADVDGRPYPDSHRFSKVTTWDYDEEIGTVWVEVRGPYGVVKSAEVTVKSLRPFEDIGGGNAAEKGCTCTEADPVNTATGEFYLSNSDLALPGVGPAVAVARTYSSALRASSGSFGYGWSSNFAARLVVDVAGAGPLPDAVRVEQENGSRTAFFNDGSDEFVGAEWVLATLEHDDVSGDWTFTRQEREVFVFNEDGILQSVSDLQGNTVEYHYSSGELTSITGSGGREIELIWASGRVSQIEDSAGRVVEYEYASGNLVTVTDTSGAAWDYGYDSLHRMTTQTYPEGGVVTNVYDSESRVTSQTDAVDRETTFSYGDHGTTTTLPDDSVTVYDFDHGDVISITEGYGSAGEATTTFGWNSAGDRTSVTDPLGNVTSYAYDNRGNALATTDPLNQTTIRTYDSLNNVTSVEDPLERLTEMTYDPAGNLTSLTSPGGHTQSWVRNPDGTVASHTDARNKTTLSTYDSAGRPSCVIDPDGRESCVTYDARGFITTSTDPADADTTYTYDDLGRTLTVTDPTAAITSTVYDDDGNPLTVEDANGNTYTFTYDEADQLLTTESPEGGITAYTYAPRGGVATITNPVGDILTTTYDALNRVATVTDGENRTTTSGYDLAGRLLTTQQPSTATTTNGYDDAGQLTSSTNALGKTTNYTYDDGGQLTSVTDPLTRTTSTTHTDDGLVDTVTYPDTSTEVHEYDANGKETSFTNADGKESTYTYTDAGLLASKTEPGAMQTLYTYDDAGRLDEVTTPNSHTSSRDYDDAGHLTAIDYQGATDDVTFTYDDLGQRLTMSDATGTTTYTYTDDGQFETVQNGNSQTLAYDYDDAGQLLTITYPGNHDVDYSYNDAGQMASATGWATGTTDYTYTPDGYLHTREDANGVTETRSYNSNGQLTGIVDSTTSTTLSDYGYAYDDAGQLTTTTMTDALHVATTQNWGYDPIGQLTTTSAPSGAYAATAAGLVTGTPDGDDLTYNTAGQLENLSNTSTGVDFDYSYNGNGNRSHQVEDYAAGPNHLIDYNYNEAGHLTGWDDGTNDIDYIVDGDGLRQARDDNSAPTSFLWDPNAALPLLLDDGGHTYIYGAGLTPIAQTDGTDTEYIYTDNIGTVRTITNDTATSVAATDYDAYGTRTTHTGTLDSRIGYTGAWTDPTTTLVYLRARDLDPRTTQFIQLDPALDTTRQPYGYTGNNPLNATDPSGLCNADASEETRVCQAMQYLGYYYEGIPAVYASVPGYLWEHSAIVQMGPCLQSYDPWTCGNMLLNPVYGLIDSSVRLIDDLQNGCDPVVDGLSVVSSASSTVAVAAGGAGLAFKVAGAGTVVKPSTVVNAEFQFGGAGRSGAGVKNFVGPPSSVVKGASQGRVFQTNAMGQVISDVTANRVKPVTPGQGYVAGSGRKVPPTPEQMGWIDQLWGKK